MKKIGFVAPWYGEKIPGGAEEELRGVVHHLKDAGAEIEVLSTCVKDFGSDWSVNFHPAGVTEENGIAVRRFPVRKRDTEAFDAVNLKLMQGCRSLSREEQEIFIREMVNSPELYRYMEEHTEEYSLFVFIPYMFGTAYYGIRVDPRKAVMIPCFHDESYFYMDIFRELYSQVGGIVYNALPERQLTERNYPLTGKTLQLVMGIGMDTDVSGDAERFRQKYGITSPFILYAGRKDAGKNVDTLIRYFREYRKRNAGSLKLVLIGGGEIGIPKDCAGEILDLGFVPKQDKYDACAAAALLCQPSKNESFSLVIMESWLCGRPVIVNGECAVTKNFAVEANGGLYFDNYFEFEGAVNYILAHPDTADAMGICGGEYVRSHFAWPVITQRYLEFLARVADRTCL